MNALIQYNDARLLLNDISTSVFDVPLIGRWIARPLYQCVSIVYQCLIVIPLQHFYIRAWWKNLPESDICAQLTHYRSQFWLQHSAACADVISSHFDAWLIYAQFFLYMYVLVSIVRGFLRYCVYCFASHSGV
jgi:hypothetical protein